MTRKFKEGDRVRFKSPHSPNARYFTKGLENLEINSCEERNYGVWESDKSNSWFVDEDELDIFDKSKLGELKRLIPGIERIPRHPVFEIAEHAPVFLVDNKVYSIGEEKDDGENFFEQRTMPSSKRNPLVEFRDFNSLDELALSRAQSDIEKIGEGYIKSSQNNVLKKLNGELDTPRFIFEHVFPYFQDGHYKDKVSELFEVKGKKEQQAKSLIKEKVTPKLEQIANEIFSEVKGLIAQIEQEGQEPTERTRKEKILDNLFDYQESEQYTKGLLLGKVLNRGNIAIVDGIVYDLIAGRDKCKRYLQINGKKFSLVERKEQKREPKDNFEVGDKIIMNSEASKTYSSTKEGSEGEIKRVLVNGEYSIEFSKLTDKGHDVPVTYNVHRKYMKNLSEVVAGNRPSSQRDLEDRFLTELGKKIRIDALKKHFSKDKIIDILRAQDAELLSIAGKSEYQRDGYGFVQQHNGDCYAYLNIPSFGLKANFKGDYKSLSGYYLFRESKIAVMIYPKSTTLNYSLNVYRFLSRDNCNPVCLGDARMPIEGKDVGEVIAKRLKQVRAMILAGNTKDWYPYEDNIQGRMYDRTSLETLKELNVQIFEGGRK